MERVVGTIVVVAASLVFLLAPASSDQPTENGGSKDQLVARLADQLQRLQGRVTEQERINIRQDSLVKEQNDKLALLERLNFEHNEKIAVLERSRSRQALDIAKLQTDLKSCQARSMFPNSEDRKTVKQEKTTSEILDVKANFNQKDTGNRRVKDVKIDQKLKDVEEHSEQSHLLNTTIPRTPSIPFANHIVETRSDDDNPLEASLAHVTQRVDNMAAKMAALEANQKASDARHDAAIEVAASSTFVRWGSSSCGDQAEVVYHGEIGGSYYTNTGAASNYLCLPMNPILSSELKTAYAFLYGAEYEAAVSKTNQGPVCAVCKAKLPNTVMIPATTTCNSGWSKQYSGYLMAGSVNHAAASEFICVDSALEAALHTEKDDDGKLLYYTKAKCGSLSCPPYVDGKVVTCVVCSK